MLHIPAAIALIPEQPNNVKVSVSTHTHVSETIVQLHCFTNL